MSVVCFVPIKLLIKECVNRFICVFYKTIKVRILLENNSPLDTDDLPIIILFSFLPFFFIYIKFYLFIYSAN